VLWINAAELVPSKSVGKGSRFKKVKKKGSRGGGNQKRTRKLTIGKKKKNPECRREEIVIGERINPKVRKGAKRQSNGGGCGGKGKKGKFEIKCPG